VTDATAGAGDDDGFAACFHCNDVRANPDGLKSPAPFNGPSALRKIH
jgi:hypothetical protein